MMKLIEPVCEKTNNLDSTRSDTNWAVQSLKIAIGFKKKRNCTIRVVKTKALISCAVTAQLICAFVFA